MNIEYPPFQIPENNNNRDSKSGGGSPPPYRGDSANFEKHKRDRVSEMDSVIAMTQRSGRNASLTSDKIFYEIEFHEDALSKSAQPRKILANSNIDVYAQMSDREFLVSSTSQNLKSFRDIASRYKLDKNKNESAYLSAITKIKPIAKEDKLTFSVEDESVTNTFLYLADVVSEEEGRKIAAKVSGDSDVEVSFFISQSGAKIIFGSFNSSFLDEISDSDPRNPVIRVERSIDFVTPQELALDYEYDVVDIEELLLEAKVAVIDSGVSEHPLMRSLIIDTVDCIKDKTLEDLAHGTFVAGRSIFGGDIERQIRDNKKLIPQTKVLDVKVMRKVNGIVGASDLQILQALVTVLDDEKYKDIKVFNLSLNFNDHAGTVLSGLKCFFTREIDAIAYKYKVCIIVTAGNQNTCLSEPYPECLSSKESLITPPADLINGLSVGSVTDTESSRSLALNNEPSPFTRMGPVNSKKPDLVHFGGNCDKYGDYAGVGVRSLSTIPNKIFENVGTSFAAPLVSSIAAQIYEYLKNTGKESVDLTKALLLHSAEYSLPLNSRINSEDLDRLVGFGIPDFSRALDSTKSIATFVYTGKIEATQQEKGESKDYKHKIKFIVPPELNGKDKKLKIRGTLVYAPMISESGIVDYALADIDVNLHYQNSRGTDGSAGLTSEPSDYRVKWNNIKSFQKNFTHYQGGEWEMWLTLTTRGKAEVSDYSQDYALVISVEDITNDVTRRIDLQSVIRQQYPIYIPVEQKIVRRVKVS